jgi:hypothetical protein
MIYLHFGFFDIFVVIVYVDFNAMLTLLHFNAVVVFDAVVDLCEFVIVVVVEVNSVFVVSDGAVVDFIVVEKSMGKFFLT